MTKIVVAFKKLGIAFAISTVIPFAVQAESDIERLQNQIDQLEKEVDSASEWKYSEINAHMTGYADVGYTYNISDDKDTSNYSIGTFAPIFHFQYRDILLLESELEFKIKPNGETEVELGYMTLDWFINDYTVLVAGKFLSPIGQFRQNLHPSWINKMPSPPPGFGHDGAAPSSELGLQFRGGFPVGQSMSATYAVYASNGPELNAETEDDESVLEGIRAEGFGADRDNKKTYGGRLSLLPISSVEIGISGAIGKATVTEIGGVESDMTAIKAEKARDYGVIGADFVWNRKGLAVRGEYIQTKIGEATTGATPSEEAKWQTWYGQAAYRIGGTKWEPVLRYTDFNSYVDTQDQKQIMIGINYLVANNFITKLAYEFNDGTSGLKSDDDRVLVQMAYGF